MIIADGKCRPEKVIGININIRSDCRILNYDIYLRQNLIVICAFLSDDAINTHCREQGIYPHHIKQWKLDFIQGSTQKKAVSPSEIKTLKHENNALKKESTLFGKTTRTINLQSTAADYCKSFERSYKCRS
jgi:hypothetical protein